MTTDEDWEQIRHLREEASGLEVRLTCLRRLIAGIAKAHGGFVATQLREALDHDSDTARRFGHDARSL